MEPLTGKSDLFPSRGRPLTRPLPQRKPLSILLFVAGHLKAVIRPVGDQRSQQGIAISEQTKHAEAF